MKTLKQRSFSSIDVPVNNPYDAAESRPKMSPVIEWLLDLGNTKGVKKLRINTIYLFPEGSTMYSTKGTKGTTTKVQPSFICTD